MYVAAASHGEKIFHYMHCSYVGRIKPKNRIYFMQQTQAREKGYRLCNCCSYMGKYYHREKKAVQKFARENDIEVYLYDDALYFDTLVASWKIIAAGKKHDMFLYHGNTEWYYRCQVKNGMLVHKYHAQNDVRKKSIIEYMDYLVKHDKWRQTQQNEYKKLPKKTKKQKKQYNRQKKKARKDAIRNVYNIIEKLRLKENQAL